METPNQTNKRGSSVRALERLALLTALLLSLLGAAARASAQSVLQGEAATGRLKEQGHYESLVQALQAARYAVEALQDGPDASGAGVRYASNPAQGLRCWFRANGLELQSAGAMPWKLNLRLRGYGREVLATAELDALNTRQNRVELSRANGSLVEWYENTAAGLEQGFTLERRPRGEGPLRLLLEAEGDLRPELQVGGVSVKFVSADGQPVLCYSGLKVFDSAQRALPAHLEVQGQQVALVVNDGHAAYPLTIDPLITSQEAELTTGDSAAGDYFGYSVSLSGDGTTALVGADNNDTPAGADAGGAYVFVRSGSSWSQQAQLTAGDSAALDLFGYSVSLSGDGNTALVGAPYNDTLPGANAGGAYVFVRSGSSWYQQAQLIAGDSAAYDAFGDSVSLSGDGNTALVGAPDKVTPAGAFAGKAYVFVRSGSSWSQQAELTADDSAADDYFGNSVSLSGDGTTALVGAGGHDTPAGYDAGSAYVFVRSGSSWSQQTQLTPGDSAANDVFGISVSLSGDGTTALVGAPWNDTLAGADAGSAYVFVRGGSSWSQQTQLTPGDSAANDVFGWSVSLSGDGSTALVGAPLNDTLAGADAGSAYVFVRSGSSWDQQAPPTAGDGAAGDYFGDSVSLSGDGTTALVGAGGHDTPAGADAGSAYVFRLVKAGIDLGLRAYDGAGIIRIACEPPGVGGQLTSPLRISKNGTNYGILLVATNDARSSKIRIPTSSGVKALMKLP